MVTAFADYESKSKSLFMYAEIIPLNNLYPYTCTATAEILDTYMYLGLAQPADARSQTMYHLQKPS